ncbi:hypothetical protein [Halobacterium wangiae]|uniref:hypothetical protein n=1 Tax=Halobacterium wangiae TaxID=2902623 RepID=UPI001E428FE9|nr:hypothetical protein [Halobacterium wangiae]
MPSKQYEALLFTSIEWSNRQRNTLDVRPRTVGFLAALATLAAIFNYIMVSGAIVETWILNRMYWLFFPTFVLFARYAIVPLATSADQSSGQVKAFLRRPAGVASAAWVAASVTAFLVLTVVSLNVFGDVVRDVLDPHEEVA